MKNKKTTYQVMLSFEDKNHSIEETWICKDFNTLKKTLCEALDLVQDSKTKFPIEPDRKKIHAALGDYADKAFIDAECKRLKNGYKTYLDIVNAVENNFAIYQQKIDKQTTLTLRW